MSNPLSPSLFASNRGQNSQNQIGYRLNTVISTTIPTPVATYDNRGRERRDFVPIQRKTKEGAQRRLKGAA